MHEEPFQQARIYLKDIRGLSDQTINSFGRQGLLAQATYHSESVLVFKSYDHNGVLQAASLQGLVKNEEKYNRGYLKKIMKGSHGHVGISFDIGNPKRLIFCESVIDMMSYYQLHQKQLSDVRLISMEGLKLSVIAYQTLRLAAEEQGKLAFLDTVKPSRLSHYLQAIQETTTFFQTHSNAITMAVDNDEAGREFCQKLSDKGLPISQDLPPLQGLETKSDWNDVVKQQKEKSLSFCESVIDMMSYYQLHQKQLSDVRLISMEGLKLSVIAYQTLRLAAEEQGKLAFLDTVKPSRLSHYLQAIQETTTFFQTHSNAITMAVDNDEAGREFCQKLSDKGLPISQDLPPLQGLETKSDWNDVVKQQKEKSLSDFPQTAQAQVIKNHPPPKRERAMEL